MVVMVGGGLALSGNSSVMIPVKPRNNGTYPWQLEGCPFTTQTENTFEIDAPVCFSGW